MVEKTIAVIGDIHGCINTFEKLYKLISKYKCQIYCVGDLIDRGNFSKEVVQFCIDKNIHSVKGNHEQILLDAIEGYKNYIKQDLNGFSQLDLCEELDMFYINGGGSTQKSYTGTEDRLNFHKLEKKLDELGHLEFFRNLPIKLEFEKVVISHAGIIADMPEINILWNRKIPGDIGKLQIFGHTPHSKVLTDNKSYVNVDTGCVYGGKLSAAIVNLNSGKIQNILSVKTETKDYEENSF